MLRISEYEQLTKYFLAFHEGTNRYIIENGILYYVKPGAESEFKKFKKNKGIVLNQPKDIFYCLIALSVFVLYSDYWRMINSF